MDCTENKSKQVRLKKVWLSLVEISKTIVFVFVLNTFVISLCRVNGNSMYPTLHNSELIAIEKISQSYDYGDIVVTDADNRLNECLVKRVVGLPGDIIDIDNDGTIYVNGTEIQEQYNNETLGDIEYPHTVPDDSYFLMGDNRNGSTDSRFSIVGDINRKDIMGKMILALSFGGKSND